MTNIVVGIDGSEHSKRALRWAGGLWGVRGGRIDAVIAWHPPVSFGWSYVPGDWNPEKDAEKVLARTVDEVFDGNPPVGTRLIVREGNPAKVLLDESRDADLLVVGSRGHGGVAGLLLGSVGAHCAEPAAPPVLGVPRDKEAPRAFVLASTAWAASAGSTCATRLRVRTSMWSRSTTSQTHRRSRGCCGTTVRSGLSPRTSN